MKKIVLSAVAVLAMSSFAVAGGDIAPIVEETPVLVEPAVTDAGFYLGLAYGMENANAEVSVDSANFKGEVDVDMNTFMLQAGYKFNQYIAVEGRYWRAFGDLDFSITSSTHPSFDRSYSEDSDNKDAWAIYVKPMYPVTEAFDVYALLGYSSVDDRIAVDNTGFSWGLGAAYSINDNISLFIDYVSLLNTSETDEILNVSTNDDITLTSWNFGVSYKF